jgi:hypothetical protein
VTINVIQIKRKAKFAHHVGQCMKRQHIKHIFLARDVVLAERANLLKTANIDASIVDAK